MFLFRFWKTLIISYVGFVTTIWGFLEAYAYFKGDHLKEVLGPYWFLLYGLPIFPALLIAFLRSRNHEQNHKFEQIGGNVIGEDIRGGIVGGTIQIGRYYANNSNTPGSLAGNVSNEEVSIEDKPQADLESYFQYMSKLLKKKKGLRGAKREKLRAVVRARTLSTLKGLGANDKAQLVLFLQEAGLINRFDRIINLYRADLSNANLRMANLQEVDFTEVSLENARLEGSNLTKAKLSKSFLENAILDRANLSEADLSGAFLQGASLLAANFKNVNLTGADLRDVSIAGAESGPGLMGPTKLYYVNFEGANLTDARISDIDHFEGWTILTGAIMPDGTPYEMK